MNQWTTETAAIIKAHCKDFNSSNYTARIKAEGGYAAYVDSLGGIFKEYRKKAEAGTKVTTVSAFHNAVEYVSGLMYIWGFDYWNGKTRHRWGNGAADAFYPASKKFTHCKGGTIAQLCQGTGGRGRYTNCNYGVDTLLKACGLNRAKGCDAIKTWAKSYGKPVTSKSVLKPGDIVHFFSSKPNRSKPDTWKNWHHVAIVHTVDKAGKKVWLADYGSRYIKTKKPLHYMTLDAADKAGGEYSKYYWTAIHHCTLSEEPPHMNGIDIASYQQGIDLGKVPGDFVIVKTTQGTYYKNPAASAQIEGTEKAGKLLGLYHYAAGGDPVAEADFFLASVGSRAGKALLALDWERNENAVFGTGSSVSWVQKFMDRVHDKTGVWPLLYCQQSEVMARDWSAVAKNCGLWLAQYAVSTSIGYNQQLQHGAVRAWSSPAIWQYTSGGDLSGWPGRLDLNIAYMDRAAWFKYANPAGKIVEEMPIPKTVKHGSSGKAVQALQGYLGGLTVDGDAGDKTITKLKAWQKAHKLKDDGVAGPVTWKAIIDTLRTVKNGSTGASVRFVQAALGGLTVDGKAQNKTVGKIKAFQKAHGLTVDGVAGKKTLRALLKTLQ